jgi:hypothetical protein
MSLSINYILLYQFINPLACWFVAETFYCFPCIILLNYGMRQQTHTYTHVHTRAPCVGTGEGFSSGFENRGSAGPTTVMTPLCY